MGEIELTGILEKKTDNHVWIEGKAYSLTPKALAWISFLKVGKKTRFKLDNDAEGATIGFITQKAREVETFNTTPAQVRGKPSLSEMDRIILCQVAEKGAIELACAIIQASYKDGNPVELEKQAALLVKRLAKNIEDDMKGRLGRC